MKNISIFQLVVLGIFGLFLAAGFIVVAVYSSKGSKDATEASKVTIWGPLPSEVMEAVIAAATLDKNIQITYVQKNESAFDTDLAEAIATRRGPDIVLLRQDALATNVAKISPVSYDLYPVREFQDTFVQASELFLAPRGTFAVPLAVDPLVTYWNRDLFSQAGLAYAPKFWDEVPSMIGALTTRDTSGNLLQSAVALGEYSNVSNAKEILSALLLESGNTMTKWDDRYLSVRSTLLEAPIPASSALSFFMQFSDARKSTRTWSRALPDSESMFLSNRLAMYFGFASEVRTLKARSPNLNFDVSFFPQSRVSPTQTTFSRLYSFSVLNSTQNKTTAVTVIRALTGKETAQALIRTSGMVSARKDVSYSARDVYKPIFYTSVLFSRSWLDPKRTASEFIFKDMIDSVSSGFSTPEDAVNKANQELRRAAQPL